MHNEVYDGTEVVNISLTSVSSGTANIGQPDYIVLSLLEDQPLPTASFEQVEYPSSFFFFAVSPDCHFSGFGEKNLGF